MHKYIAPAAIVIICLAILSSASVPQDITKWPATPNEPIGQTAIPTPTPPVEHVPVTINMGNSSDLSFIYEGGKLAYVQLYSKDYDGEIRIMAEDYRRLASMGRITYYGTFAPGDHSQVSHEAGNRNGMQEKPGGLSKSTSSIPEMVTPLRDFIQGMINKVRTDVVPAVNGAIVSPLRGYAQGMINKVRTSVT